VDVAAPRVMVSVKPVVEMALVTHLKSIVSVGVMDICEIPTANIGLAPNTYGEKVGVYVVVAPAA